MIKGHTLFIELKGGNRLATLSGKDAALLGVFVFWIGVLAWLLVSYLGNLPPLGGSGGLRGSSVYFIVWIAAFAVTSGWMFFGMRKQPRKVINQ
ncbi:MAG: hypothetical protein M1368_00375 [Thaumarchaeota archaeon]|nr:hypothetical protein [Nitrososphaerota archaeon]